MYLSRSQLSCVFASPNNGYNLYDDVRLYRLRCHRRCGGNFYVVFFAFNFTSYRFWKYIEFRSTVRYLYDQWYGEFHFKRLSFPIIFSISSASNEPNKEVSRREGILNAGLMFRLFANCWIFFHRFFSRWVGNKKDCYYSLSDVKEGRKRAQHFAFSTVRNHVTWSSFLIFFVCSVQRQRMLKIPQNSCIACFREYFEVFFF